MTPSDWVPPSDSALDRITDARASQYFDRNKLVAKAWAPVLAPDSVVVTGEASYVKDSPAWDSAFVFPAGAKWEATPPTPTFAGAPVYAVESQLRVNLTTMTAPGVGR